MDTELFLSDHTTVEHLLDKVHFIRVSDSTRGREAEESVIQAVEVWFSLVYSVYDKIIGTCLSVRVQASINCVIMTLCTDILNAHHVDIGKGFLGQRDSGSSNNLVSRWSPLAFDH